MSITRYLKVNKSDGIIIVKRKKWVESVSFKIRSVCYQSSCACLTLD
jgi:hypothetical protein